MDLMHNTGACLETNAYRIELQIHTYKFIHVRTLGKQIDFCIVSLESKKGKCIDMAFYLP